MIEGQCARDGFTLTSYQPFQFTGTCKVTLSFDPAHIPGWKRQFVETNLDYVS